MLWSGSVDDAVANGINRAEPTGRAALRRVELGCACRNACTDLYVGMAVASRPESGLGSPERFWAKPIAVPRMNNIDKRIIRRARIIAVPP